ncbi:MAG: GtrA family protein [Spirulinaceae cyanobacterium RM2_2_10]|nr:GtrA family protein [Spirulinaceae cyanobacterium SM2_1_0]NJO21580.1 GtrA family protein [Spirulinaceae cyanobacterium RM2_2_10]
MLAKLKQFTWHGFFSNSIVRWWIVGLFFTGANLPLSWLFKDVLLFPAWLATLLGAETVTLLRYFANDRWVFGYPRPSWLRLWQYHVAMASSFVLWYAIANVLYYRYREGFSLFLVQALGNWITLSLDDADTIGFLLAQILATCCSVFWTMVTNFLWIWRKPDPKP